MSILFSALIPLLTPWVHKFTRVLRFTRILATVVKHPLGQVNLSHVFFLKNHPVGAKNFECTPWVWTPPPIRKPPEPIGDARSKIEFVLVLGSDL